MNPFNDENGGPAFPISIPGCGDNGAGGMTLRDWFAGQAVASDLDLRASDYELTEWFGKHRSGIKHAEIIAARAYDIADAMLQRRKHKDI